MIAPLLEIFPALTDEEANFTGFGAEVVVGFGKDRCYPAHKERPDRIPGRDGDGLRIFAVCRRYADGRPTRVKLDGHWGTSGHDMARTLDLAWQALLVGDLWVPYDDDPSIEGFVVGEIRREDYEAQSAMRVADVLGSGIAGLMGSGIDLARYDEQPATSAR